LRHEEGRSKHQRLINFATGDEDDSRPVSIMNDFNWARKGYEGTKGKRDKKSIQTLKPAQKVTTSNVMLKNRLEEIQESKKEALMEGSLHTSQRQFNSIFQEEIVPSVSSNMDATGNQTSSLNEHAEQKYLSELYRSQL